MIKFLLTIFLFYLTAAADVDLYLQAHEDWRRGKPTTNWTKKDFREFHRQTDRGNIIDILEAGRNPGDPVKPPSFVKITVTGVTLEQARAYLEPLIDSTGDLQSDTTNIKQRRFFFEKRVVDSALALWDVDKSHIVITKQQAKILLKEYDIAVIKQKIRDRLKE